MSGMYWYAVAASDDVAGLKNKGFCVTSDGEILYNEQYEYALARMYTSDGHGIVDVETSNFFFDKDANDRITINAEDPMTTPVLSYKLRITDQYPDAEWFYFAADKSEEILEDGVPHPLYKSDGTLATKTGYADCEFEALNPMPSEVVGMYGRFTTATFSFATYQSTADVLHVEFTGLHQEEAEYCFADRLRVVVPVVLPSVNTDAGYISFYPNHVHFVSGATNTAYVWDYDTNRWILSSYDPTKTYAAIDWYAENSGFGTYGISLSGNAQSGVINITNILSYSIDNYIESQYATCDSTQVEVVPVFNSSSILYNAFKYTVNNIDYYYVLDGTQTDWTDDLSSIGYKIVFPLDLIVGMSIDYSTGDLIAVTFDYPLEDNYWNTRVKSAVDKELLRNLGLWVDSYLYGSVRNTSSYRYEIIEIYTGIGEGVAPFDLSDFYIPDYQKLSLGCTGSYSTPVKSWKVRITPTA